MDTYPKNGGKEVVSPTPQFDAEAFITQFFKQLQQNVPAFADMTSRRTLTGNQQAAADLFRAAGTGLAVGDFSTIAAYLPARDNNGTLRVDVPDKAVAARVFSQTGVKPFQVQACAQLTMDSTSGRVFRIEFLDANGAVIEATGREAPLPPPPSTHRVN